MNDNGTVSLSSEIRLNCVPNINLKKFSSTSKSDRDSSSVMRIEAPYSYDVWLNQANKITLYIDSNNWAVGELDGKRAHDTSAYTMLYFTIRLKAVKVNGEYSTERAGISSGWRDLANKCDNTGINVTVVFSKTTW